MRSVVLAGLLLLVSANAYAQECELVRSGALNTIGGGQVTYFSGPVAFACPNNVRIAADSAIFFRPTDRFEFMGNVRYGDGERDLTAAQVQYARAERKVMAQINVVLTNKKDGSTLRATSLDYYQDSPQYPGGRIDVLSGRPRGTMIRQRRDSNVRDTTVIDADRMQIVGENTFRGWGNVNTRRGTLQSTSQYAEFDEPNNRMRLTGKAVVQYDTFRLRADSIDAVLINGDEFRELHAFREVILESEDVDLTSPVLHLNFEKGEVQRLVAIGGGKLGGSLPQARAVSPDFILTADSIDALSPAQKLERVHAVGRAHGERWSDTIADRELPQLIRNDWVKGDTIRAFFGEKTTSTGPVTVTPDAGRVPGDSTRVLERVLATGNPASSTYRMREQVGDTVEISVNYITAKKLDVTFKEGEVDNVKAEGDIRGLYLQPPQRAQANGRRQQQ